MKDNEIIEEAIRLVREGVNVTLPVKGRSMLPFIIGGKESVILHRPGLIDVGDVVLAWVDGNRYVVHRIINNGTLPTQRRQGSCDACGECRQ